MHSPGDIQTHYLPLPRVPTSALCTVEAGQLAVCVCPELGQFDTMSGHMGKSLNVAVVGATGLVGQEFLKIALQRNFPH